MRFLTLVRIGRAPVRSVLCFVKHAARALWKGQSLVPMQVMFAGRAAYLAGSLACSVSLPGCKLLSFCCPGLGVAVNLHLWQVRDCCHDKLGHPGSSDIDSMSCL